MNNPLRDFECRSAAASLSDMELFVFPELIYALTLANIMSPRIWTWRSDPWFDGIERMKPYRRMTRLKQFIMDHYAFNLDLETWGLTTREREIARFEPFIDTKELQKSNALFGYEGDKYYFDIDIRTHFGLEKYNSNIIPYWKTETVEAMDAFQHKEHYSTGAGECVSLATLYAAALFVVARIPLRDIYLMATPLHSQNFVDVNDGILTNNRRLVTKNMWFNGTALSAQARRALENEQVTLVAHESGVIHVLYDSATISPKVYQHFKKKLTTYLNSDLTVELLGNFLRQDPAIHRCFQLRWDIHGTPRYLPLERAFAYENNSPYMVTDNTRAKLIEEMEQEEFQKSPLPSRIILNDLEDFIEKEKISLKKEKDTDRLRERFSSQCINADIALQALINFCHTRPRLPDADTKQFIDSAGSLGIEMDMSREEIIEHLTVLRESSRTAELAFYAWRDLRSTDYRPFLKAALERCPVPVEANKDKTLAEIEENLQQMPAVSIYDGEGRLAQPDEVWNYQRGDGLEKAILMANLVYARSPESPQRILISPEQAQLETAEKTYAFPTGKGLPEQVWECAAAVKQQVG